MLDVERIGWGGVRARHGVEGVTVLVELGAAAGVLGSGVVGRGGGRCESVGRGADEGVGAGWIGGGVWHCDRCLLVGDGN